MDLGHRDRDIARLLVPSAVKCWEHIRAVSAVGRHRHSDGCHSFHATGITAYLKNGGQLEVAQRMANHESARTTGLYDRLRRDELSVDEVGRILI